VHILGGLEIGYGEEKAVDGDSYGSQLKNILYKREWA
jgi:hypothetical protein